MVLRTALEQVRHQCIEGVYPKVPASTFTPLMLAVESYLDVNIDFYDSEKRIIDLLTEQGHITPDQAKHAFIESSCREHDVVHLTFNDNIDTWLQIDRNGNVEKL